MANHKSSLFPLILLISGCAADDASLDELSQASPTEVISEREDAEEVEIIYREATESLEVVVDVEKLTRAAQGSTIEMKIDVTTPDGTTTRHDLHWTNGEDLAIPRIEAPVLHNGSYEVVVTELAIDGRALEMPGVSGQRMRMNVQSDLDSLRSHNDNDDGNWDDDGGHDDDDDDDDDDGGHHDGGGWDDDDDGGHDDGDGGWDDDGGHGGGGGGGHGDKKCKKKGKKKHGSDHNDKLHGSDRNDSIYGYDGKDKLWGYECNDKLYGGRGDDNLKGGKGKDYLDGGKGYDRCEGGAGKDEFRSCEDIY
jgi:hypothetical protein